MYFKGWISIHLSGHWAPKAIPLGLDRNNGLEGLLLSM